MLNSRRTRHAVSFALLAGGISMFAALSAAPAWSQEPAAAPAAEAAAEPAAEPAAPEPFAEGKYLATAGNCISCHTREGGEPFAGGLAFKTDFGTIYSTNITSDPKAGIGAWTEEQFVRAMREGIAADGTHLYPAFPYTAFTKVSDADLKAMFAYLKSVPASSYEAPANEMSFPFNQRSLMSIWNTLFFKPARFTPDQAQSAEWNRGAYLVEGLGHCGACHTPRNFLGAEQADLALAGGVFLDKVPGGQLRPWATSNLTSAQSGLKAWTVDDIAAYLKTGHSLRGGVLGPMNEVFANSTRHLTAEDTKAMAVYLKSLPARETSKTQTLDAKATQAGETLYTIHCGTCHLPTGLGATPGSEQGPPLAGSTVVQAANPASLINVILYGASAVQPVPAKAWHNMKAFGNTLEDDQVATLANYLRTSWGNIGGPVTEADVAKQR